VAGWGAGDEKIHRPTMPPITFGADRYFPRFESARRRRFRCQQAAFSARSSSNSPTSRSACPDVDTVIALLGGEDARLRLVEARSSTRVNFRKTEKQLVVKSVGSVPHTDRQTGMNSRSSLLVIRQPAAGGLMQRDSGGTEVGDAGESELIEGRWWTCRTRGVDIFG